MPSSLQTAHKQSVKQAYSQVQYLIYKTSTSVEMFEEKLQVQNNVSYFLEINYIQARSTHKQVLFTQHTSLLTCAKDLWET